MAKEAVLMLLLGSLSLERTSTTIGVPPAPDALSFTADGGQVVQTPRLIFLVFVTVFSYPSFATAAIAYVPEAPAGIFHTYSYVRVQPEVATDVAATVLPGVMVAFIPVISFTPKGSVTVARIYLVMPLTLVDTAIPPG